MSQSPFLPIVSPDPPRKTTVEKSMAACSTRAVAGAPGDLFRGW